MLNNEIISVASTKAQSSQTIQSQYNFADDLPVFCSYASIIFQWSGEEKEFHYQSTVHFIKKFKIIFHSIIVCILNFS